MIYKIALIFLYLLVLGGCASTGGTIGGLVPAPKSTKGQLENGVYTAQDLSFSVRLPFEAGSDAYTYMAIDEKYSDLENNIQFSSSAVPAEVYRINIFKDIRPEEQLGRVVFDLYQQQMESAYNTPFENEETTEVLVAGVPTDLKTYYQYVPERSSLGRTAHELHILHSCMYVERNSNAAFICVNRIKPGTRSATNGSELRLGTFLRSFSLE